jgi:hypothetical protein
MPQTLLLKTALNMKVMFGRVFNKYTSKVKTDEDESSFPKKKKYGSKVLTLPECQMNC